ncbi:hypothetical protein [Haloarchaeobius sp. TZWWS8]|uniref:hypothetical protein n=1 Tax=Haloarchaeobius sp. TZWWS8 TaxID=3446121 RepID=UPI003EB70253
MRRLRRALATASFALLLLVGTASAHGVTTFAPPIPTSLLLVGAAGTVALTAAVLGRMESMPTADESVLFALPASTARGLGWLARGSFLLGFCWAIVAGLTGPQQPVQFATVFVWPVWFKGVLVVSALVGSPWRWLSPWATAYDLLSWLEGRDVSLADYPERLGTWPAAVGFLLLVGVVENLTVVPTRPRLTAALVAIYAVVMLGGAAVFGRAWFERADPLGAFYRLVGRVAPLRVRRERADGTREPSHPTSDSSHPTSDSSHPTSDSSHPTSEPSGYAFVRTSPWDACSRPLSDSGAAALAVAAVYTVSFDGLVETSSFQSLLFDARSIVGAYAGIALYVGGFLAFLGSFWLVVHLAARLGGGRTRACALAFGSTLLPIAVGYDVAHNYPYVVRNLVELVELAAGTTLVEAPLGWLSASAFWGSEVLLIVLGHVAAVLAAHAVSMRLFDGPAAARRGHAPLVVLMVGYTVLSLWVLSRPIAG